MNSPQSIHWVRWWLSGYVVLMAVVVGSMFWERHKVIAELSTPQSIADWETWREDVRHEQTEPGTVQRRVPKSAEPPALVLMRDYFGVSLVGATLFSSMLYWVMAWFVTGALRGE